MSKERLDKILASSGLYTRSEVKDFIKKGLVYVNNEIIKDSSQKFDCEKDDIIFNGKALTKRKYTYIMLNKPKGVVSATDDKKDLTVVDILPDEFKRKNLFPAGRLDKDTTGFCLITDDGEFAHNILSPSHHVDKTYVAVLNKSISFENAKQKFKEGIVLADGTVLLSAELSIVDEEKFTYQVVIKEGKYHQVKRMFSTLGATVLELKRIKIGELELDYSLKEGESKILSNNDLSKITKKHII